ncbi:MAG: 3-oxoacyl-[acyl-carrier-protein] reductase [Candidatus Dormibacteraceae bacterium]
MADPQFAPEALPSIPIYPDLAGKVAVVTGGSKGIGAATCRLLGRQGVMVTVVGRDQPAIEKVVGDIKASGGHGLGLVADCRDFKAIEQMRTTVERDFGPADVVIAYAGGFGAYTPAHLIDEAEWHDVVESNLTTTFLTTKSFLPGMIERRRGTIITMASNTARFLDILTTASYAASKAGIIMFSRHVAKEVGQYGIRVNCVAPATVLSERVGRILSEARQKEIAALAPLGRMGTTDDVALATLFLASDSSSWLTGVTLDVAGGRIML